MHEMDNMKSDFKADMLQKGDVWSPGEIYNAINSSQPGETY
jgi:hypothetical protein